MSGLGEIAASLRAGNVPFLANHNIAAALVKGDVERIEADAAHAIETLLDALVIDWRNDHNTRETPARVARMLVREVFRGRYTTPPEATSFANVHQADQIYVVGPIAVRSCCAHHLVPIIGQAWVGVIPGKDSLIGLSKHHRLVEWVFARPQIQEEAMQQAIDVLETAIGKPRGVGLIVRASHLCTSWRGVRDGDSLMVSSVMHGIFKDDAKARAELMTLIQGMGYRS